MAKIIQIDEISQAKLLPGNIMLQHMKKSKSGRIAWVTDGNFSTWPSMCEFYISNSPYRTIEGTAQIERLIEVVIRSTDQISRILITNQINDTQI
jgi:hypothetical protein